MAQRYIYLSDELNNKLKDEDNASRLIQNLLIEYYNSLNPKQAERALDQEMNVLEAKRIELLTLQKQKENEEKQKENSLIEQRNKSIERLENMRKNVSEMFLECMKRPITKEELDDYIYRYEMKQISSIFAFMEEKGWVAEVEENGA